MSGRVACRELEGVFKIIIQNLVVNWINYSFFVDWKFFLFARKMVSLLLWWQPWALLWSSVYVPVNINKLRTLHHWQDEIFLQYLLKGKQDIIFWMFKLKKELCTPSSKGKDFLSWKTAGMFLPILQPSSWPTHAEDFLMTDFNHWAYCAWFI